MKKFLYTLLFFISLSVIAQRKYAKEFSFYNDNDLFTSTYQDRYYTNGMFFSYRYLAKNENSAIEKKIFEFQLGHEMYTPHKATVDQKTDHDRPFAAYLYGSFGFQNFYSNNSALKISAQVGVIGPSALGWELQDLIHDIYGFKKAIGWKYQIANAFAFNLNSNYKETLFSNTDNTFDVTWNNNFRLGTVFTDISTGLYTRIGFKPLQKLVNSIAFNSNLNDQNTKYNNETEVFLFVNPTIHYVLYDATIQGSFLNDNSMITYDVKPIKFTTQFGIRFTSNRFNFGYIVNLHTKKLKSLRVPNTNFYGTIIVNYQFN